MSKYIKLYDAIMAMDEWFCEPITPTKILSALPTIEVSEDCISREYLEEEYWQTLTPKEIINTDVELGINIGIDKMHDVIKNAPSVIPKDHSGESTEMVDIVRCRECKCCRDELIEEYMPVYIYCEKWNHETDFEDFCSAGERIEE